MPFLKKLTPDDFGTMQPRQLFIRMALPPIIGFVILCIFEVAEGMMLGNYGGGEKLAAVSIGMPFISIISAFATVISVGSSTLIAINLGKNETESANRIFTRSTLMVMLFGLCAGLLIFFFSDSFLHLFNIDESLFLTTKEFLLPFILFSPLFLLYLNAESYLALCGRPVMSMALNIIFGVVNVALDVIFIIGMGMGSTGVALSSAIGMVLISIIGYAPFIFGKLPLRFVKQGISIKTYGKILYSGASTLATSLSASALMIIVNGLLLRNGQPYFIAAHSIVITIMPLAFSVISGLSTGIRPVIAYCFGKKEFSRLIHVFRITILWSFALSAAAFVILLFFGPQIVNMYLTDKDFLIIYFGSAAILILSFQCLTKWIVIDTATLFVSVEKAWYAILVRFLDTLIIPVLCLAILVPQFNNFGVWIMYPVAGVISAVIAVLFFIRVAKSFGCHSVKDFLHMKADAAV